MRSLGHVSSQLNPKSSSIKIIVVSVRHGFFSIMVVTLHILLTALQSLHLSVRAHVVANFLVLAWKGAMRFFYATKSFANVLHYLVSADYDENLSWPENHGGDPVSDSVYVNKFSISRNSVCSCQEDVA